jgi:hypothetical protein
MNTEKLIGIIFGVAVVYFIISNKSRTAGIAGSVGIVGTSLPTVGSIPSNLVNAALQSGITVNQLNQYWNYLNASSQKGFVAQNAYSNQIYGVTKTEQNFVQNVNLILNQTIPSDAALAAASAAASAANPVQPIPQASSLESTM